MKHLRVALRSVLGRRASAELPRSFRDASAKANGKVNRSAEARWFRVFQGSRPRGPAEARCCRACQGGPAPAAPPRPAFEKCVKDSRPRRPAEPRPAFAKWFTDCRPNASAAARFCKVFQRFPPQRLRRSLLSQNVSKFSGPEAPPRPAFAKCFKDSRLRGPAEARCCRMFHGIPAPAYPPRPAFAQCFKDSHPRDPAEARFCRIAQREMGYETGMKRT